MAEYIERKEAIKAVRHAWAKGLEPTQYIEAIPAADVVEVRHGKWLHVHVAVIDTTGDCSVCNTEAVWRTRTKPYSICPNCGARMDGDSNA